MGDKILPEMAYRNSWTLDAGRWTLDSGLWTLEARLWTLGIGCWILDVGEKAIICSFDLIFR